MCKQANELDVLKPIPGNGDFTIIIEPSEEFNFEGGSRTLSDDKSAIYACVLEVMYQLGELKAINLPVELDWLRDRDFEIISWESSDRILKVRLSNQAFGRTRDLDGNGQRLELGSEEDNLLTRLLKALLGEI